MLKLSKLADYSVVILASLARDPSKQVTAAQVSEDTQLPIPTVAKLLKKLAKSSHVKAVRGAAGGYKLAHAPEEISISSIIEAVDGPVQIVSCASPDPEPCSRQINCVLHGRWDAINTAIRQTLKGVTLKDLMHAPARVELCEPPTDTATASPMGHACAMSEECTPQSGCNSMGGSCKG